MEKVRRYIDEQFKKLPKSKMYRQLKENILLDSQEKVEDYKLKYGERAEDKIIEEIGTHYDLYHGGLFRCEKLNFIGMLLLMFFLILLIFLKPSVRGILDSTFDPNQLYFGMPIYFIIMFPDLFGWVIGFFILGNLLISFYGLNKKLEIKGKKVVYSIWLVLLFALLIFMFQIFVMRSRGFLSLKQFNDYIYHDNLYILIDIIFGTCLGLAQGFSIQGLKN